MSKATLVIVYLWWLPLGSRQPGPDLLLKSNQLFGFNLAFLQGLYAIKAP